MTTNHVTVIDKRAGRRINSAPGARHNLCGGALTDRDVAFDDARRLAKAGELRAHVSCAECCEKVAPTDLASKFGIEMARAMFAKRGNNSEMHLSENELAAALALAFETGQKASSR